MQATRPTAPDFTRKFDLLHAVLAEPGMPNSSAFARFVLAILKHDGGRGCFARPGTLRREAGIHKTRAVEYGQALAKSRHFTVFPGRGKKPTVYRPLYSKAPPFFGNGQDIDPQEELSLVVRRSGPQAESTNETSPSGPAERTTNPPSGPAERTTRIESLIKEEPKTNLDRLESVTRTPEREAPASGRCAHPNGRAPSGDRSQPEMLKPLACKQGSRRQAIRRLSRDLGRLPDPVTITKAFDNAMYHEAVNAEFLEEGTGLDLLLGLIKTKHLAPPETELVARKIRRQNRLADASRRLAASA